MAKGQLGTASTVAAAVWVMAALVLERQFSAATVPQMLYPLRLREGAVLMQ